MRLEGKAAMVTGAASGIGRATAETLAREGAAVMCADLNLEGAQAIANGIAANGGRGSAVGVDVRDETAVRSALEEAAERLGGLQILVNSAGITGRGHTWDELIPVNLNGVYYSLRHGAPLIERHGGGAIVNLSSIAGLLGSPRSSEYSASKHGVVGLTRSFALEFAPRGVRVNCVNPSYIETPMNESYLADPAVRERGERLHPIGRLGRAQEVANTILFLVSDEASFITGVALPVDGGYTAQ